MQSRLFRFVTALRASGLDPRCIEQVSERVPAILFELDAQGATAAGGGVTASVRDDALKMLADLTVAARTSGERGQLEAKARLGHLIEMRGIGLLTGEAGCGKTTVCRKVCEGLHSGLFKVSYISLTTGASSTSTTSSLPNSASSAPPRAMAPGAPSAPTCRAGSRRRVNSRSSSSTRPTSRAANAALSSLTGLTELRRRLTMAVHDSLAQRIVVRCYLPGLARGVPRKVDTFAHHALHAAAVDKARQVTIEHVHQAREDLEP